MPSFLHIYHTCWNVSASNQFLVCNSYQTDLGSVTTAGNASTVELRLGQKKKIHRTVFI